jgi:hypothetical protein
MLLRALSEKSKKTLGALRRLLLETDGELREAGEA